MLLRHDVESVTAIPQPSHAWMSGQIARAWGNDEFERPAPWEDVCLAVEQHDIGWLDEDLAPVWETDTGLPREFWHVPARDHTALWSQGVRRAALFSRYAALLVSLHGLTIYDLTFDPETATPDNREAVARFRTEQRAIQDRLREQLSSDPLSAEHVAAGMVERNRRFLLALDTMSLHLCWGLKETVEIKTVPRHADETCTLTIRPMAGRPGVVCVEPWPFRAPSVTVKAEGRRLSTAEARRVGRQQAWENASPVSIAVELKASLRSEPMA